MIRFELPVVTPTLNQLLRSNYHARAKANRALAWQIRGLTATQRPPAPFDRAAIRIERWSIGTPDHDGLVGGCKDLIDCLLDPGTPRLVKGRLRFPHPHGLGFIADDSPAHLDLEVVSIRVAHRIEQRTIVTIRESLLPTR